MASAPKQWIVLMNKVPRGPLSEEQIRALLKEGLVRHNDTAFQISLDENGEKKPSEWKLLWQFAEFDRRTEENKKDQIKPPAAEWSGSSTPQMPKPESEPERRKETSPEEAKEKVRDALPPEMLDIAPEDLVVHSTTHTEPTHLASLAEEPQKLSLPSFSLPSGKVLWALGGILILLVSVGVFRMGGHKAPTRVPMQSSNRIDTNHGMRKNLPAARTPSRPAGTRVSVPGAGPRPVSPRSAPEPRLPASSGRDDREDRRDADRGEIEREEDELDEDAPRKPTKARPTGNRRSRVLSDEDEEDGGGGSDDSGEED